MFRLLLVCFALCAFIATFAHAQDSEASPAPAHRVALDVNFDTATHTAAGTVEITWTNESDKPAQTLYFHLYLNAFKSDSSVFMRESGGQLRGVRARDARGHIELHRLELVEAQDSFPATDLLEHADRELIEGDETQLRVPLPRSVFPGESIHLVAQFTSQLPRVFARSGYSGDFNLLAQWFPKLARREKDGSWATFPYHAHGEFYADFADYDVRIVAPSEVSIAGTGRLVDCEDSWPEASSTVLPSVSPDISPTTLQTRCFEARRVHDVAYFIAPEFVSESRVVPRPFAAPLELEVFVPLGFEWAVDPILDVTEAALFYFDEHYFPYPHDTLSIVLPPPGASGAAGMEYPQFFTSAGSFLSNRQLPIELPMALHEHVTVHELGHQWFQGVIASNEVERPFLDEGLTEWITCDFLQARYGAASAFDATNLFAGAKASVFEVESFWSVSSVFFDAPSSRVAPASSAADFRGTADYGRLVYGRSTVVFETIARTWGRTRFHQALGDYARAHRFAHPDLEDFYEAMVSSYGTWMRDVVLSPALEHAELAPRSVLHIDGELAVQSEGLAIPVDVRVTATESEHILRARRGTLFVARELGIDERSITSVEIDPFHKNLLDPVRWDNTFAREPSRLSMITRALRATSSLLGPLGP